LPNELRELGRLGRAMNAGAPPGARRHRRPIAQPFASRRRLHVPRGLVWVLVVVSAAVVWVGVAAARQADPRVALATIPAAPAGEGDALPPRLDGGGRASRSGVREAPAVTGGAFAVIDGLALKLPAPNPRYVGFHEASRPEALALDPIGRLIANDNPTKFTAGEDRPGPAYRVLSSRGRARPATSAVDVVLDEGTAVMAPISGKVVEVKQYALYGSLRDWRIVIEPTERPDLQIVLIHLEDPRVRAGHRVVAGATPLATVRLLPMASHVDYALNQRRPHVHIEVKPAVDPEPFDPNAPAVEPEQDPDASAG
jgi:hypothetical protein